MGIKVVAEGVETREQFDLLSGYRVDEIQGNLLSKAVMPGEIESMMPDLDRQFSSSSNVLQFRL